MATVITVVAHHYGGCCSLHVRCLYCWHYSSYLVGGPLRALPFPGILCLHRSLQRVNSSYPLVILTTPSVSPQYIQQLQSLQGCIIHHSSPPPLNGIVNHANYARPLYAECWTKLRMWEAEEYGRIVYLDADMVVLRNIDHLFDMCSSNNSNNNSGESFFAVRDCFGGRLDAKERDACGFFDNNTNTTTTKPDYFNAGFCVLTPNKAEYQRMLAALPTWPERESSRYSEQDFLNYYYKGTWKHLPYTYNAQKRIKVHHPMIYGTSPILMFCIMLMRSLGHIDLQMRT